MASLVLTLRETLRYRGAIGQWSWVLHRLTGLGVVLFLILHVIDTSWAVFFPEKYVVAIATYQTPLFTLGEFALVLAVVYHALNGLRIAVMDFRPDLWKYQQRAAYYVLAGTAIILVPVFLLMLQHVIDFYSESPQVLPLGEVLIEQLPFVAGMVAAAIAALVLSFVVGLISGNEETTPSAPTATGSNIEKFWWSFMRISGILIIPLVFGHLAFMHVLQGVFDLTAASHSVVGTTALNETGTAVEFVHDRWSFLVGGIAIWRVYDTALLALVVTHGFNGLRYVLTDYTMYNPFLRRAAIYACLIGALVLLVQGGWALVSSIDQTALDMAVEATRALHGG